MNDAPMFEVDGIEYYRKVGDSYVRIEGPVDTTPVVSEAKTPDEIKELLWEAIPEDNEYNDPVSLHNTQVLAAFIRGEQSVLSGVNKPLEVKR